MSKAFLGVGHGGSDPGAIGNGLREKDLTLSIAKSCGEELERHNVQVLMSRYSDENDPIQDEVRECNNFSPDLAVDIHINAGGGDGFEVFYHKNGGPSKTLAANIEKEVSGIGQNSRGLKTKIGDDGKDYYMFIRETNPPAAIVECAFIDSSDIQIIDTLEEQKAFGKAIARGILKTLGLTVKEAEVVQKRYFVRTGDFLATNGLEINSIKTKYFYDIERLYVNPKGSYVYLETQYLSKEKCNEVVNRLSKDNLYADVVEV